MSESGLILSKDDLRSEFGRRLGYGRDVNGWDASQTKDVEQVLVTALRWVYFPDDAQFPNHRWSFLSPIATLTTIANIGDYDLPFDYGGMSDPWLTYASGVTYPRIPIVMEHVIREHRSDTTTTGFPTRAAVRSKKELGASGTRWEILFWPTPSQAWTLSYRYEIVPDALTDARPFPLGSPQLSELFRMAGLAVVEQEWDHEIGPMTQKFNMHLASCIRRDAELHTPKVLGQMFDPSCGGRGLTEQDLHTAVVTYEGTG